MYSEIKTTEIKDLQQFVADHATSLDSKAINIRKRDGMLIAECFDAAEPATP